jgi:putative ABC transport system permease protein
LADVLVRTQLPPDRLASELRSVVSGVDPAVAVSDVRSIDQLLLQATAERRFQTILLTAFGGVAFFLSLVGLYGLMACLVEQRTAEMGIRMALGAQPGSVLLLILKQGSRLAFGGIALGLAGAWIATRFLASLLYEVAPTDMPTFLAVAFIFASVALAACYIPARRATKVDPVTALRCE